MDSKITLCKIAEEVADEFDVEADVANIFHHNGKTWRFFEFLQNHSSKLIEIINVYGSNKKLPIVFEQRENDGALMAIYKTLNAKEIKRQLVVQKLFDIIFKNYTATEIYEVAEQPGSSQMEDEESTAVTTEVKLLKKYVTTKLYDVLYDKHQQVTVELLEQIKYQLPDCFQPKLCRYQESTVKWLLMREQRLERSTAYYTKLVAKDDEHSIYKHLYCADIQSVAPPHFTLEPGGILADEMGLGKTVEMLALILLHPRSNVAQFCITSELDDIPLKRRRCGEIFCICPQSGKLSQARRLQKLVQCCKCAVWQHAKCVANYDNVQSHDNHSSYMCPKCWKDLTDTALIETKATFIVTPSTIRTQWLSEIQRHINPNLRVLIYEGVANGTWISPRQLAEYDIVLTDYSVLQGDVYHTMEHTSNRVMRNKPRSMRVHTPLLMLHWWRVCLDEAQMVESNTSKVAALVRTLPAINRWAVTGTPIQRTIDDLYPLLLFIGFEGACYPLAAWHNAVQHFVQHPELPAQDLALIDILQKCMWRTCKSKVIDEIQIPPQSEQVHRIDLGNLEKLFYMEQHTACEEAFNHAMNRYIRNAIEQDKVLTISPQIMKIVLQPLLKIRQCCTIPVVGGHNGGLSKRQNTAHILQKQFLQPKELHAHLKATNEIECKSELRSMASSYNGMAAIYFLTGNYKETIRHYEFVLQLARDYKDMKITVDSLLQIHALHNILQTYHMTMEKPPIDQIEKYEQQCYSLEWKYLEPYAATLKNVQISYQVAHDKLINLQNPELVPSVPRFMQFLIEIAQIILADNERLHEPLINSIRIDHLPQYGSNTKLHEIRSIRAILYIIDVWYEKLQKDQKTLSVEFKNLSFFIDNVKARNQVSTSVWREMMQFVSSVYDCHLSEIRELDKNKTNSKTSSAQSTQPKKSVCKLCKIQDTLNSYECLLFDKVIDKDSKFTEGLDTPAFEVSLIKAIFSFVKSKAAFSEHTAGFERHWDAIECMQSMCKKLIKLWIEIEYTVKAYDELDMCKMRLSFASYNEPKSTFKIRDYEMNDVFRDQQITLHQAQFKFATKLARLKYITHLEDNADTGPCPICRSEDEPRYAVLECGHHICYLCLKSMRQYTHKQKLSCAICRNEQSTHKIYYITRAASKALEGEFSIVGDYSSKIACIVRLILKLKHAEEATKILIFSQWLEILSAIAAALKENDIVYRLQCSVRTIEEFKNAELGVTCLLMPLTKGSKGLNLIEATHVFLVEPILNPAEELQAIGRVHRFGQTKATTVHRFIVNNTIEDNVFGVVSAGKREQENWEFSNMSLGNLKDLFKLQNDVSDDYHTEAAEIH